MGGGEAPNPFADVFSKTRDDKKIHIVKIMKFIKALAHLLSFFLVGYKLVEGGFIQTYSGGAYRDWKISPWRVGYSWVSPFSPNCTTPSWNRPLSTCLFQGSFTNTILFWFKK